MDLMSFMPWLTLVVNLSIGLTIFGFGIDFLEPAKMGDENYNFTGKANIIDGKFYDRILFQRILTKTGLGPLSRRTMLKHMTNRFSGNTILRAGKGASQQSLVEGTTEWMQEMTGALAAHSYTNGFGNVNLYLGNAATEPGELDLVVTGFNRFPYENTVMVLCIHLDHDAT